MKNVITKWTLVSFRVIKNNLNFAPDDRDDLAVDWVPGTNHQRPTNLIISYPVNSKSKNNENEKM